MSGVSPRSVNPATVFNIALFLAVILGVLLRLRAYLSGRSLWLDESSLALGFVDVSLAELLLNPLPNFQSAPPGFLFLTYIVTSLGGISEFSLRAIPMIASMASVVIVYLTAKKYLSNFLARAFLIGSFAISPVLIYYASEFKQYSLDVLAVSFFALTLTTDFSKLNKTLRGLFIAFVSLLVFSSLIAIPVFAIWLLARYMNNFKLGVRSLWKYITQNALVIFIPAVFVALHGLHILINRKVDGMVQYWTAAGGLPPADGGFISWLGLRIANTLAEPFVSQQISLPRDELDPVISWLPVLILISLGLLRLTKVSFFALGVIAIPVVLSIAVIYPLGGRLTLFLIPVTLLLAAKGIDAILEKSLVVGSAGVIVLAGAVALNPIMTSGYYVLNPNDNRDTKWAMEVVSQSGEEDVLLLDFNNRKQVEIQQIMGFKQNIQTEGISLELASDKDYELPKSVWLLSTHRIQDMREIRDELINHGFTEQCLLEQDATMLSLLSKDSRTCELTKP